jgi:hypothetical protein
MPIAVHLCGTNSSISQIQANNLVFTHSFDLIVDHDLEAKEAFKPSIC